MLRAVSISQVLARCAAVLDHAGAGLDSYEMSVTVERIDAFVSHNWCVSRSTKFAALSLYFMLGSSVSVLFLFLTAILVCTSVGLLPTFTKRDAQLGVVRMGAYCTLLGPPLLLFLMTVLPNLLPKKRLSWINPSIFLDRCCIFQRDPGRKLLGIQSLAAFLAKSDSLVVLYSDFYMRKMWTVYEFATFLALHDHPQIIVVHHKMPLVIFSSIILWYIVTSAFLIVNVETIRSAVERHRIATFVTSLPYVISLPGVVIQCGLIRKWHKQIASVCQVLDEFSLATVECSYESDRATLTDNIVHFMKARGYVPLRSSREEAIRTFEAFVRRRVPLVLSDCVGITGLRYKLVVVTFLPHFLISLDHITTNESLAMPVAYQAADFAAACLEVLGVLPSAFVVGSLIVRLRLKSQSALWSTFVVGLAAASSLIYYAGCRECVSWGRSGMWDSYTDLLPLLIVAVFASLPSMIVFGPCQKLQRRTARSQE